MYALAIIRYRKPLEEVLVHQDAHRAYLRGLKEKGVLIASGPMNPRFGGMLLMRVADEDPKALDAVRDGDPFFRVGRRTVPADRMEPGYREGRSRSFVTIGVVLHGPPPDQMLLDDALEHRRIARAVPSPFRIHNSDRAAFADPQAIGFRAEDAARLGQPKLFEPLLQKFPRLDRSLAIAAFRVGLIGAQKDMAARVRHADRSGEILQALTVRRLAYD